MNVKVPGRAAGKGDDSKVFILANPVLDVDSCVFSVPMFDSSKLHLQAMVVRDRADIDGVLRGCSRLLAVIGSPSDWMWTKEPCAPIGKDGVFGAYAQPYSMV
jgi:hypothetical protein